jgi:hypothetical protein
MSWWRKNDYFRLFWVVAWMAASSFAAASEHHGQVTFSGLPVPGATVIVTQGSKKSATVTDWQGVYSFPDLADGTWTINVEMLCFSTIKQEVTIGPNAPTATWELKLLPLDQIRAATKPVLGVIAVAPTVKSEPSKPADGKVAEAVPPPEDISQRAADGLLINGSVNNAAASQYSLAQAFGNNRNSGRGLYTGGVAVIVDSSAFDARPYSLSGQSTPKADYNQVTGVLTLGGPIRIPHLLRNGPNFIVVYEWMRDRNATTLPGLVPDQAERDGDFSQETNASGQPFQIFNPATGLPFPGNIVPISPQAQALLKLYPLPNFAGNSRYNYQVPIVSSTHQDSVQTRLNKTLNSKNQVYGTIAFQSSRSGTPNLFNFLDTTDALGINTTVNWSHQLSRVVRMNLGFQFSRISTRITPYWENRENIAGEAGITGNSQDPTNWGPPTLSFSSGVAGLSDSQSSFNRNRTDGLSFSTQWNHSHHNVIAGGDFRRQEYNYLSQQDPRGSFFFTGVATQGSVNGVAMGGSDVADFLLGVPDTSSIAFGNADKYLRESVYDAYITDDWRVDPQLTVNIGVRWEYSAPITELHDRLVNLDVASGFTAVAQVLASDPVGTLTQQHYPTSLLRQDKNVFEPRIAASWRPIPGSSMVVRAGYGIYSDTSVYQSTALQMAQQAPLSKSLSVQNSPTCPLTLANGFNPCSTITANTFAVDPNFRVGYAQLWQLSVQRDLPASLQMTATYLGTKGTRGVQEFYPNTYPIGAANPCPDCPSGFAYLTSYGNSTREAGQIQLRRRLHNGFTASLQYTYSKSIDDDGALGGQGPVAPGVASKAASPGSLLVAQNWLNLNAERGLSTFDQRHLLNVQMQYTTGMGAGGGTLMGGWRGEMLKEWTVVSTITAGTGLPQTPIYAAVVPGTGFSNSIRPNYTGASIYAAPSGLSLNPAAYTAPASGQWGTAGRNSITGPGQFSLNASLGRTFRVKDRYNLDLQIFSTNLLNHAVYTGWITTVNNAQFGTPLAANPMRSLQTTLRLRF